MSILGQYACLSALKKYNVYSTGADTECGWLAGGREPQPTIVAAAVACSGRATVQVLLLMAVLLLLLVLLQAAAYVRPRCLNLPSFPSVILLLLFAFACCCVRLADETDLALVTGLF